MRLGAFTVLFGVVAVAGCQDRAPVAAPPVVQPPAAPEQRVASLRVSDLWPSVGDTVVVTGIVAVGDSMSVASFRVRLRYNARLLRYVDEVDLPGMLRVVNPRSSEVVVAGASGTASPDGRLFSLRFRVDEAGALESLSLAVDELNNSEFISQLSMLRRSSQLLLDRKGAGSGPPVR